MPQTVQNDTRAQEINPEISPATNIEQPSRFREDISGLEADKDALKKARVEQVTTTEGQVFETLRAPKEPIPTQEQVQEAEQDPFHKIEQEVEAILQAELVEIDKKNKQLSGLFTELPPDIQSVFKQKGEAIANEIVTSIREFKLDPAQLQTDIKEWLKLIPEVHKPWLEQMATLKKDKILNLYNQLKRDPNYLN